MKPILSLTRLYLLGSLRRQTHLATLFLGVILFMLPAYINAFSLGMDTFQVVTKDFGLILIGYFAVGMAILLGSTSVPQDRESRAIYPILARPLSRLAFLTSHLLALVALIAGSLLFLGICLGVSTALMVRLFDDTLFVALYGSFLQAVLIGGVCLACSVRLSPSAAGSVGAVLFFLAQLSSDFLRLWLPQRMVGLLKAAMPDLSLLTFKEAVVHGASVSPSYLLYATLYALGWMIFTLYLANVVFEEVDL